jgi:shikimate dehydrogenase
MHNAALAAVGLNGWRYQLLPVPPELVEETLRALGAAGFRGVNVTIPHKRAALAVATDVTPRARQIGAANTLVYDDDGRIVADNTDAPALISRLPPRPGAPGGEPWRSALVLGAGGSARAAVWALRDAGVADVAIWNRTSERARTLAGELGGRAVENAIAAELLVNCTAVGLEDRPGPDGGEPFDELPLAPDDLAHYTALVDYVYASAMTPLVAAARARGIPAVDGLDLLVAQGALAFERFTGRRAPERVMAAAAREQR